MKLDNLYCARVPKDKNLMNQPFVLDDRLGWLEFSVISNKK